ncbi:hypothetical protein [uncultured Microbacterium sp.]|uniref:hypothetical protein n=1 Tax=uncultured Microbacterium sp. TaxID=191216 RepID=UPI0035CBFF83
MRRGVFGLALAAFVIVGFVFWVGAMPKPAAGPLQAVARPVSTPATSATASDDPAAPSPSTDSTATEAVTPGSLPSQVPAPPLAPATETAAGPDVWAEDVSSRTRVSVAALRIYADVVIAQQAQTPGCGIDWTTLAALADPVDVVPVAIDASSRAVAAALCDGGRDLAAPGGLEGALSALGRTADQAHLASVVASAYASAAAS